MQWAQSGRDGYGNLKHCTYSFILEHIIALWRVVLSVLWITQFKTHHVFQL